MVSIVFLFLLVIFLIYRHFTWTSVPWPTGALTPRRYQGHRGYWQGGAQENTLASFAAAAERGLEMVELDVRLSRDLKPVVFHDIDLKRLGARPENVNECTAEEMKKWVQAPLLEEVLISPSMPRYLNIEIKNASVINGQLEEKVAELITKHQAEDRVLFSSFNPISLWRLSRLLPNVPRALLASQEKDPENKVYLRHLWLAPYVRPHALHLDYHFVSLEELARWKKRKVPVALWTVNDPVLAESYLREGALSIISDSLKSE